MYCENMQMSHPYLFTSPDIYLIPKYEKVNLDLAVCWHFFSICLIYRSGTLYALKQKRRYAMKLQQYVLFR